MLAIMLVAVVVFFPVTFLFGVSKYLFTALALGVVFALFASYFCAVTVVPLYCAYVLKAVHAHGREMQSSPGAQDFTPVSTPASRECWMSMKNGFKRLSITRGKSSSASSGCSS